MPTSAVNRSRNPPTTAASSRPATAPSMRQQRGGPPSSTSVGLDRDSSVAGGQEDPGASTTKNPVASARSVGVERGRLGRVLHQQVRVEVHSDQQCSKPSPTTAQKQQTRPSRSTPATDTRRSGLPRSTGATSSDAAKGRSRSSNSSATEAGRQASTSTADNDSAPQLRVSATLSTGNAEKSEEELEKMRILARHIKVRRFHTNPVGWLLQQLLSEYM